jgi:hypothetical protein
VRLGAQLFLSALAAFCACGQSEGQGVASYTGAYTNVDYGFSVTIPPGLKATGAAKGAPNHGFVITLPGGGILSVNAIYDILGDEPGGSFEEQHRNSEGKPTARLGSLEAWDTTTRTKSGNGWSIARSITAVRTKGTDVPIIYVVSMSIDESRLPRANPLFDRLVQSFVALPIGRR